MGILDSNAVPAPTIVPLDPQTQGLINQGTAQAGQSSGQFTQALNNNVSQNTNQLGMSDEAVNNLAAKTGTNAGMIMGLRNAYQGQTNYNTQQVQQGNQINGAMMKYDYTQKMAQVALGQQAQQTQAFSALTNAYNNSEAARASMISSLFQTANAGMVAYAGARRGGKAGGGGGASDMMASGNNASIGGAASGANAYDEQMNPQGPGQY